MKFSLKYLMPPLAAVAAFTFASPAFAWSHSICNPTTGQVFGGNGASPLTTEKLYYDYLHDHPGSFEMSPGKEGQKTVSQPAPTSGPAAGTTTAATVTAPAGPGAVAPLLKEATAVAVIEHDGRPWFCHYESSVGFATPRRSNDLFKDLARVGNTAIGANGQCAKAVESVVATATPPLNVAGVQIVGPLAPPAIEAVSAAPVAPGSPVSTLTPAPPAVQVEAAVALPSAEPELVPITRGGIVEFAAPAAGDGSTADVLVP